MKIVYEDSLPYAEEFFSDLGDCEVFSHRTVTGEQVADADVLLVRSTTKVNRLLLDKNKRLQYVATATAGTDHMDFAYLQERGTDYGSAGGCNAVAVAEYVLSAIFALAEKLDWQLAGKVVGIVGAGHVGSALQAKLAAMGMSSKLCDPPLAQQGDPREFVSMKEIMQCDVISLHVPLISEGPYVTQHLFDHSRLNALTEQQILINACRGEVVDNTAALKLFRAGKILNLALDVWENEPAINQALVPFVTLATAHIAGHTIEGKARGTEILYQQLCKRLNKPIEKLLSDYLPPAQPKVLDVEVKKTAQATMAALVFRVYDIRKDDAVFRQSTAEAEQFRYIRKHYPIRREFSAFALNAGNYEQSEALYALGFAHP